MKTRKINNAPEWLFDLAEEVISSMPCGLDHIVSVQPIVYQTMFYVNYLTPKMGESFLNISVDSLEIFKAICKGVVKREDFEIKETDFSNTTFLHLINLKLKRNGLELLNNI